MERATEVYAFLTCLIVGLSHVVQRRAWVETFAALHRMGRPGAFANGAISLATGSVFAATHPVWSGPETVLTALGWLLVAKGAGCFLAPDAALRSMARGTERGFAAGGTALLAVSAVLAWVLWRG